jgi:hypothetical protein
LDGEGISWLEFVLWYAVYYWTDVSAAGAPITHADIDL